MPVPPTILVVDEPNISTLLCLVLADAGFQALSAASGPEAVALYRSRHPAVDLVLLDKDVAHPRTLDDLRAVDPDVRLCLLTAEPPPSLPAVEAVPVLCKPFPMEKFVSKVRYLTSRAILP